jgi:WD40 repeat protein
MKTSFRLFGLISSLFFFLANIAYSMETRLVSLDLGTFNGEARGIAILDHGERFATAGSDRVIRIYNSTSGAVEQSIAGYADVGDGGDIHSLAASPDSKHLAVGVNFGGLADILIDRISKHGTSKGGAIFDRQSGKLVRLLDGHTLTADHVFYTNDGTYLISVAQELLAWDADAQSGKKEPERMIPTTSSRVADIQQLWAAPAGNSRQARVLVSREENRRTITLFEVPTRKYISSVKLPDDPLVVVAKGENIAVTLKNGGIMVYDGELKKPMALSPAIRFSDIDLNSDGSRLIACRAGAPFGCLIGEQANGFSLTEDKTAIATDRSFNPLFLSDKRLLLWGNDGELRLHQLPSGKEERRIVPRAPQLSGADIVGSSLLVADKEHNCRNFNPASGTVAACAANETITSDLPRTWQGYQISRVKKDTSEWEYAVLKGKVESTTVSGGSSEAPVGFLDNGLVIATSPYEGFLDIYTLSGSHLAELIGHEGKITSIRQRGDLLITTGADRTVRLWDISAMRGLPPENLQIDVTGVQPGSVADLAGLGDVSRILAVNGKPLHTVAEFREQIIKAGHFVLTVQKKSTENTVTTIELDKPEGILGLGIRPAGEIDMLSHLSPFATLLLTADANWLLWSERTQQEKSFLDDTVRVARYAASEKVNELLRWRNNQGKEKEAKLVPFDKKVEYETSLPVVALSYAAGLAGRATEVLTERFKVSDKLITDRKTSLIWLRNVSIAFAASGHDPAYLLKSINGDKKPLGKDDWRFPTESEAQELFALLAKQRRRTGSFLEETTPQLLRRAGFLCVTDQFESIALDGRRPKAWSLNGAKSYEPGKDEMLRVLLVRGS